MERIVHWKKKRYGISLWFSSLKWQIEKVEAHLLYYFKIIRGDYEKIS